MSMPVVLRSTFEAAKAKAAEIEAELRLGISALREALDRARDDHDAALIDRDRVASALARADAEIDRHLAALSIKQTEVAEAIEAFGAYREEATRAAAAAHADSLAALALVATNTEAEAAARADAERALAASAKALANAEARAAAEAQAREAVEIAHANTQGKLAQTTRMLEDFRAETARLGAQVVQLEALRRSDSEAMARVMGERDRIAARLKDFEAEAKRLGGQVQDAIAENHSLSAQLDLSYLAERQAYARIAACTRDPLLIGTLPRSGTWMLRYFLSLFDHFSSSRDLPSAQKAYEGASVAEFHLDYGEPARKSQLIALSHWLCPGGIALGEERRPDLIALLRDNGSLDYQRKKAADHAGFHPERGARIIFVYRNPLDVYRSYADLFERRNALPDRKPYPFNPMVPWGAELMNASSDQPFEFFIENLLDSGFAEFFVTYFASFLLVQDAYPNNVLFLRYEDAMRDRRGYLRSIVEFGRLGNDQSADAFDKAVAATEIDAMKRYEAELGHAISGASTFYGERNDTHLSVKKREWRDVFRNAQIAQFRDRVELLDHRVLEFLPELSA